MEENQSNQNNNLNDYNSNSSQSFKNASSVQSYKAFENAEKKTKEKGPGFGKTVLLPFLCGALGAVIVIGGAVSIPSVKDTILKKLIVTNNASSDESNNNSSSADINTQLISLTGYSDTATGVAKKVQPSIVAITVEYSVNSVFNRTSSTATAKGSGIIISEDGYILTNNHVVNSTSSSSNSAFYEIGEANKVTVKLYNDDTEYEGEIIGTDSQTDLAVIKIDKDGLTAAELGNSDSVQVGEFAMALGSPLGLENSVTAGIVSAVNREVTDDDGNKYTAIQTDAAINSGNSGGALVNSKGQVIGVNTLKLSGTGVEGVGFAIPINSTKSIYEQLIEYSKVKRPYIGIGGKDLDEKTAKQYDLVVGIYVRTIDDFSAAEKAGLRIGDVIIEAEGQKVTTMDELNAIKNKKQIGDTMKLKINRDGKEREITITLQEQP